MNGDAVKNINSKSDLKYGLHPWWKSSKWEINYE